MLAGLKVSWKVHTNLYFYRPEHNAKGEPHAIALSRL